MASTIGAKDSPVVHTVGRYHLQLESEQVKPGKEEFTENHPVSL